MNEFLLYAVIAGSAIVSSLCPLGCIILWRRLPYLGDAIAHSSILGIVIGFMFGINVTVSIVITGVLFSFILILLRKKIESNILVVIFSYSFLALGLFLLPFVVANSQIDIFSYLFGDILLVDSTEIYVITICSIAILVWIYCRWKPLLLMSINEDLAIVEGVNLKRMELEFMLVTAFIVGISIKIIGVLLMAAILVIPAAAARNISRTPAQMLRFSVVFGVVSVLLGIACSYVMDSPSGPSIILASLLLFILSLFRRSKET